MWQNDLKMIYTLSTYHHHLHSITARSLLFFFIFTVHHHMQMQWLKTIFDYQKGSNPVGL